MKKKYLLRILVLIFPLVFYAQSDFDCSTLNPVIENTEINICEPGGNVTLEAQTNLGNEILWYESKLSETPLHVGNSYSLGNVNSYKSFWVAESYIDSTQIARGQVRETYSEETAVIVVSIPATDQGLVVEAYKPFGIEDFEIYSTEKGGDVLVTLRDED